MAHITRKQKQALLYRFDYKCQGCDDIIDFSPKVPEFHHIDNNPDNNDPSNLVPYCHNCHKLANMGMNAEQIKDLIVTFHGVT